jgi:hypothetical protein
MVVALKRSPGYPVFPRGGAHWNHYASLRVTQELISRMESLLGKRMVHLAIQDVQWDAKPRGSDGDLVRLANVWRSSAFYAPNPYPTVVRDAPPGAFRPKILAVGGSFMELPNHWLRDFEVVSEDMEFSLYYRIPVRDPEKEVFRRDVVLLETNEARIGRRGFGFVEALLAAEPR